MYTIRALVEEERDELLEFESNVYDDIELRSKDNFSISSVAGQPRVIQNYSVGKYWVVFRPTVGCMTIIVAAFFVFGTISVAMLT
jgi:hypothetical protein